MNTTMTWKDIKLATLQKMFAADGSTLPTDESTTDYIAGMPYVANEALQMIASAGKFIIRPLNIGQVVVVNILGDSIGKALYQSSDNIDFTAECAQSYYFEYYGSGTLEIYVDGSAVKTIELPSTTGYKALKGLITNADGKEVKISFSTKYLISIKNIALYGETFESESKIPDYSDFTRYDMDSLATDFFMLDETPVSFEGTDKTARYLNVSEYHVEGGKILLLPSDLEGNFIIYYKAYPSEITIATPDSYVMPITPEVATLLPLYMASQLYKDDDNGIATSYRNEFEVAFNRLKNPSDGASAERFISESGWI